MFHVPPIAIGSLLSWQEMENVRQTCHYLARQYAMLFAQKICVNCANLSYLPSYFLNHVKTVSLRHYNIPMHMISHDHWTLRLPSGVRTLNLYKTEFLPREAIPNSITALTIEPTIMTIHDIDFLPSSLKKLELKSDVASPNIHLPQTLESFIIHEYLSTSTFSLPLSLLHLELNNSHWGRNFGLITLPFNLTSLKLCRGWRHWQFTLPASLQHLVIHTGFYSNNPYSMELIAFPSLLESLEICNTECTCEGGEPLPKLPVTLQCLYTADRFGLRYPFVHLPKHLTHLTITNHIFEEPLFYLPSSLRYLYLGHAGGPLSEMMRLPPFLHTFHFQPDTSFFFVCPTLHLDVPNTLRFLTIPKKFNVKNQHPRLEIQFIPLSCV
jgi:hypothetical protein